MTQENEIIKRSDQHIWFYASVNEKEVTQLAILLHEIESECCILKDPDPITLHIHSGGGSSYAGLAASAAVRLCKVPVTTIVEGYCASAATLMSVVGNQRLITVESRFKIHQPTQSVTNEKTQYFIDEANGLEDLVNEQIRIYMKHSKLRRKRLDDLMRREIWLSSADCLKAGFVDEVI